MSIVQWQFHRENGSEIIDVSDVPKGVQIRFVTDRRKNALPKESVVRQVREDVLSIQMSARACVRGLLLQCEGREPDENSYDQWLTIDSAHNRWCSWPNEEFPRTDPAPLGAAFRVDVSFAYIRDTSAELEQSMIALLAEPHERNKWRLMCWELEDVPRDPLRRKKAEK